MKLQIDSKGFFLFTSTVIQEEGNTSVKKLILKKKRFNTKIFNRNFSFKKKDVCCASQAGAHTP